MRRIARAFRDMRLADWRFFILLVPMAALVRLSLVSSGYNRTIARLPAIARAAGDVPMTEVEMRRYRRAIGWASRISPPLNCLSISIAAWWLLRRRGIATRMRFGMARPEARFLAHAWLDHFGRPVTNEPRLARYTVFDTPLL